MKRIKNKQFITFTSCLLIILFFGASSFVRQSSFPFIQNEIEKAINNDMWDFTAEYAQPLSGQKRYLTGSYYVHCRKDTLIVALPYYGRLTSAAGARTEDPLDFKSTDFKITKEKRKKGGWYVTISPANTEAQSMVFTFFDNGSASANFTMKNRSAIDFTGKIAATK